MAEPASPPVDGASALAERRRPRLTGVVSLALTGLILAGLYWTLDVRLVVETLLAADPAWIVVSVGLILPITALRAVRFYWVVPAGALPGVGEALRVTLAASALNAVLPSKVGDLPKSYVIARDGRAPAGVALAVIAYERLCDLFGLIAWCVLGWMVGRPDVGAPASLWVVLAVLGALSGVLVMSERAARLLRAGFDRLLPAGRFMKVRALADGWPDLLGRLRGRRARVVVFSTGLWLVHLFQIWLFTVALGVPVPAAVFVSLVAVAMVIGQIPLTVAGMGSRDVALVVLLAGYKPEAAAAALGVLVVTRNLVPPLVGLPFMGPYLSSVVDEAVRWRRSAGTA
jgi:uncharacterized membrane protein YbhN (UPF0104 family)